MLETICCVTVIHYLLTKQILWLWESQEEQPCSISVSSIYKINFRKARVCMGTTLEGISVLL